MYAMLQIICLSTFFVMGQDIVVIQLAAILVATSFDNAQPVIKWGGLVIAVGSVVASVFGG